MNEDRTEQLQRVAHAARCTVQAWLEDRLRPNDGAKVPLELSGLLVLVNLLRTLDRLDKISEETVMTMFPYRATYEAEIAAGFTHEEIMRWIQPGTHCPVRLDPKIKHHAFTRKPVAERFRNDYDERYMTTFPLSEFIGEDVE